MSQAYLLGLVVVAIGVLLVLVITFKLSAYLAMLLVAVGTALAGGLPLDKIIPTLTNGMGKTLGSVAIIVGLGAMLGKMIEESGGAERLANAFTQKMGWDVWSWRSPRPPSSWVSRSSSMWASSFWRPSSSASPR